MSIYKNILENISEAVITTDLSFAINYWNKEAENLFEYTSDEIIGKPLSILAPKDEIPPQTEIMLETLSQKKSISLNVIRLTKSNKEIHVSIKLKPLFNEQNELIGTSAILKNIEDKIIETEKRELSEQKYKLLAENSIDTVWAIDLDLKFIYNSKSSEKLFGYTLKERKKKKIQFESLFTPESVKILKSTFHEEIQKYKLSPNNIQKIMLELEAIHKSGKYFWVNIIAGFYFDSNNKMLGIQGRTRDITDKKNAEAALKDSEKKYRLLAENSVDVIWSTDMNLDFTYNSKSSEKLFGYSLEERKEKKIGITDLYAPYAINILQNSFNKRYKEYIEDPQLDRKIILELEAIHKDGHHFWVKINAGFYFDELGKVIGIQGSTSNITKEREFKHDLIVAKEKAEDSDKLKSAFLASVSHELRTPLNAIIGFSSMFEEKKSIQKLLEYGQIINTSGLHLLKIIESTFNIALLQSKKSKLNIEEFEIKSLFTSIKLFAITELKKQKKQNISLIDKTVQIKNSTIKSDRSKITQVLTNLVNNAVKYTTSGSITYGYLINAQNITFYIEDTGSGIEKIKYEHIFQKFTQIDESKSLQSGVGLGLAICKEISSLLKGEIWVESKIGQGSTFYFQVPLNKKNPKS